VLQCRFGVAGHSDAVLTYETDHDWDDDAHQMRTANYTGALGWDAVPPGGTPGRPEPVVWCQAPPLRAEVAGKLPSLTVGCEIVPAGLGERVGDFGALALVA
jgi:hypothetical protein